MKNVKDSLIYLWTIRQQALGKKKGITDPSKDHIDVENMFFSQTYREAGENRTTGKGFIQNSIVYKVLDSPRCGRPLT